MIVYGDPSSQESFRSHSERLVESLSALKEPSLDALRTYLIRAGVLEQAVEDALPGPWTERCRTLTDALAEAFLDLWLGGGEGERPIHASFADAPSAPLVLKFPEGFAFYALYPEAYARAAERWLEERPNPGRVLVVGLRSIGTTLSAVVASTLRARGVDARRLTIRPTGHPFHREAILRPRDLENVDAVLVVDEGPGLSGSSMASVAQAVHAAGLPRECLAFFSGHGNPPGPQASEGTRAWWAAVPRYWTPTEALRWQGRTLEEILADRTALPDEVRSVEELSGGRWRAFAYADEEGWPPIDAPFERRKLLVTRTDGTALLWKFVGLMEAGTTLGFAPTPWIAGRPLNRQDLAPDVLQAIARHLAATAGPPLPETEAQTAYDRLADMLHLNAKEAGESLTLPEGRGEFDGSSALDDRLAPHEWRRLPGGEIVKLPRPLGVVDHTVVGRHPLAWAVAAAIVEWAMDEPQVDRLLDALRAEGLAPSPAVLPFYRAAYAAFRLGMTLHCLTTVDSPERGRLNAAESFYRTALRTA